MGSFFAKFFSPILKSIIGFFSKIFVGLLSAPLKIFALSTGIFSLIIKELPAAIAKNFVSIFIGDEDVAISVEFATRSISEELQSYIYISYIFYISLSVLIITIFLPLLYKRVTKNKSKVFISFHNSKEDVAKKIERNFKNDGLVASRLPFIKNARHQDIVEGVANRIKTSDAIICIPGNKNSFVESEISMATGREMPVSFLVSEKRGSLPDTANKRYPVFSLEKSQKLDFKPVADFISLIAGDFRAIWLLCVEAFRHKYLKNISRTSGFAIITGILILWIISYIEVKVGANSLFESYNGNDALVVTAIWSNVIVLSVISSIIMLLTILCILVLKNYLEQIKVSRKASLKAKSGLFRRQDWIGILPGLSPGGDIYECLLDEAPKAHHEIS